MKGSRTIAITIAFSSILLFAPAASAAGWGPLSHLFDFVRNTLASIEANTDAIATNGDAIGANADAIAALGGEVGANSSDIAGILAELDALSAAVDALYDAQPVTGSVEFEELFTGTACQEVLFDEAFGAMPRVYASINHNRRILDGVDQHPGIDGPHQSITVWFEEVDAEGFRVCVDEVDNDNVHDGHVTVDWLAL